MRTNNNFRTVIGRTSQFRPLLFNFFHKFSSTPRLLLEVFIRKDFGRRYFFLSGAITLAVILAVIPHWKEIMYSLMGYDGRRAVAFKNAQAGMLPEDHFISPFLTWYLFLAAFLYMSVKHHIAKKANQKDSEFSRYSKNSGRIHQKFYDIQVPFIETTTRNIECIFEPALFFLIGVVLYIFGQALGDLLIWCSLCYGFGYAAAYFNGDEYIADKIDEIIIAEDLESLMIEEMEVSPRGVPKRADMPSSSDSRRKVYERMILDEDIYEAK